MNRLSLLALGAIALAGAVRADAPAVPEATPAAPGAAAPSFSAVSSLSDAECLAIAQYMQQADLAVMNTWLLHRRGSDSSRAAKCAKAIATLPADGLPDDFRRYMQEYCALVISASEKHAALNTEMLGSGGGDATWDLLAQIRELEEQQRKDTLALGSRYTRASLLGSGWEKKAIDRAKNDLLIGNERARAYLQATPEAAKEKPDSLQLARAYVRYLTEQPLPGITAAEARRMLERMELLKLLDPGGELERNLAIHGVHTGDACAVRLPHDASTQCSWKLAEPLEEDAIVSIEWQLVPTESLKAPKPHGNARPYTPVPSTPEAAVALLRLNRPGTANLRFICTRAGDDTPLAEKTLTFYIRRTDDYRPLMDTETQADAPYIESHEPGVASLSDQECLAIHLYLQKVFCAAMEECAQTIEKQQRVNANVVAASSLPSPMDKLPQDFHGFQWAYHKVNVTNASAISDIDSKEGQLDYGAGANREQRRAFRKQRDEINQRWRDQLRELKDKYPRASILTNDNVRSAIFAIYDSYNSVDSRVKQFYAEQPEMKEVSHTKSRAGYFRYLAAERAKEEHTIEAARRTLERLDALRLLKASIYNTPRHCFHGTEGDGVRAVVLPAAPATGFSWKLASPLPEDSPVEVSWTNMPAARLHKLREMRVIDEKLPESDELTIATIRLKKAGTAELRFICTRPGDDEPLLTENAEIEIRAKEEDEY